MIIGRLVSSSAGSGVVGTGDVVGPGSSTDRSVATWNGTGGDELRDNPTVTISSDGVLTVFINDDANGVDVSNFGGAGNMIQALTGGTGSAVLGQANFGGIGVSATCLGVGRALLAQSGGSMATATFSNSNASPAKAVSIRTGLGANTEYMWIQNRGVIVFDPTASGSLSTSLECAPPTSTSKTITLPDATGTVALLQAANIFTNVQEIQTGATFGAAGLLIDQDDTDQPIIEIQATVGSGSPVNAGTTITTFNGDGAVIGPQAPQAGDGYTFYGMAQVKVNGSIYWTPLYQGGEP